MHRNLWVTSGWDQRFCHLHFQCFGGQHSAARSPTSTSTATSGGNSQLRRNRSSSFGCRMAYGPSLCCQARPGMFAAFSWHTKAVRNEECPFLCSLPPQGDVNTGKDCSHVFVVESSHKFRQYGFVDRDNQHWSPEARG